MSQNTGDREFTTREVALEKLRIGLEEMVSERLLDASVSYEINHIIDAVRYSISGYILAEPVGVISIKYPADWWQALKERFAPAWFMRRWPVEYTNHEIDIRATYPNFRPAIPNEQYRFHVIRREWTVSDIFARPKQT